MKATQVKTESKTSKAPHGGAATGRTWESFPKPQGWSMDWDERGLTPGRPNAAKS